MKRSVRILLIGAVIALSAGWLALRQHNNALEAQASSVEGAAR